MSARRRRGAVLVAVVVAILATLAGCSTSDATDSGAAFTSGSTESSAVESTVTTAPAPATTVAPTPPTTVAPVTTTASPSTPRLVALEDAGRPVVTRGRTVAATRRLPTLLWLPPGDGPHPLVVFAHGYSVGPLTYARFCAALSAAGYVVAAPSFPLADGGRGLGLDRGDLPNESTDVSFVIASLRTGSFASSITPGPVGVVGHSDGADVALEIGYQRGLADPAVGAVVAIAPDAFDATLAPAPRPPLLLMHADADSVVPYSESVQVFGAVSTQRTFITLLGADHLPPVAESTRWTTVVDTATIAFLDATLRGSATIDAARRRMAVAGLSTVRTAG